MRRSRGASLAAIAAVATLVLAACGGGGDGDGDASEGGVFEDCKANPNTCNAVPAAQIWLA
jgi:peptide/nickel transport system substrate-binding protein